MFIEATTEIAARIAGAIQGAARATGASFEYLLNTAHRESSLDPAAKATGSSATGLFQFVDQTWLETLKTAGPELGYSRYADAIRQSPNGQYSVADPKLRREIMDLRKDPAASSAMAAALTQRNAATLSERLGRDASEGELYAAHVLGANGAAQLIAAATATPKTNAVALFPSAARANPAIFYDAAGAPRSAAQVYANLTRKPDSARAIAMAQMISGANAAGPPASAESAEAGAEPRLPVDAGPMFHGLFRTERSGPVSAFVSELWGAKADSLTTQAASASPSAGGDTSSQAAESATAKEVTSAPPTVPPVAGTGQGANSAAGRRRSGQPLDLLRFMRPEVRAQIGRAS